MHELRTPDGRSIYVGEVWPRKENNMTMGPEEAMNVMRMAQNIQDLNIKVMNLETQVNALVDTLNAMARHWGRTSGQNQPQQPFAGMPDQTGGMG